MGKNANELAMRDTALAALMGVDGMSDFGDEVTQYGEDDFGAISFGNDMGLYGDDMGVSFGDDYGADAPAAAVSVAHPAHPLHTANPHAQAIIAKHLAMKKHEQKRAHILEPNAMSNLKVERYTFSINASILALGTSQALSMQGAPDVNFRPQRVTMNVVSPGMVFITDGRVANVSFTVGGMLDAWQFNANSVGQGLDVPTLTPANKATVLANYTGLVPSPLSGTGSYQFSVSFTGPATLSA